MNLSKSGRIVLIDDDEKEAKPLMETLGKNGIPFIFYSGEMDKLPDIPLQGVRFVFLDIQLKGMEGQDDKTKASGITVLLKKIISESNGPYFIIFWTKHHDVIDKVIKNCYTYSIPPVDYIDLEKTNCKQDDGSINIEFLSLKIEEKLLLIGAFLLYVEWENILHSASIKFVNDFSGLIPIDKDWTDGTSSLFYELFDTYNVKIDDHDKRFQFASRLLNRSFQDTLQNTSDTEMKLPENFKLEKGVIDKITKSKINRSLFLYSPPKSHRATTGYIYFEENDPLKNVLINNMFKPDREPENCRLCKIIITPECDLAHQKTLRLNSDTIKDETIIHRIVYGLLFYLPENINNRRKPNDAQFPIGSIWYNDKVQMLIVHFFTISFQKENELGDEPLFALKRDILFDLQSKAANHINRLGNFQLE